MLCEIEVFEMKKRIRGVKRVNIVEKFQVVDWRRIGLSERGICDSFFDARLDRVTRPPASLDFHVGELS